MIALKRINKQEFFLNADLIESLESTPDTIVTLTTGKKLMIADTVRDVVDKVIQFKQLCFSGPRIIQNERK